MEPIQGHSALLPYIVEKFKLKTIALTSTDDETGLIQAEDAEVVAKRLGLAITDKSFAPRGTADFAPMLTKLIAKKPGPSTSEPGPGRTGRWPANRRKSWGIRG